MGNIHVETTRWFELPMFGLLPGALSARSRISLRLMSQPQEQCYAWSDTPGASDVNKGTCLKILGG